MLRVRVIKVHHLEMSRSTRVLWMLEELELPYEIVKYERNRETSLAPKELEAIHPLGKSPVIVDGDTTIAESGAILEYLAETYGKGRFVPGTGTQAYRDYRYFMHYAEGSLMPYLLLKLVFVRIAKAPAPFFVRPVMKQISSKLQQIVADPNIRRHHDFLAKHLETHTWFAGEEITAADIHMSYPVEALVERGGRDVPASPHLKRWLDAIRARPAFRRAVDRGGPVMLEA